MFGSSGTCQARAVVSSVRSSKKSDIVNVIHCLGSVTGIAYVNLLRARHIYDAACVDRKRDGERRWTHDRTRICGNERQKWVHYSAGGDHGSRRKLIL